MLAAIDVQYSKDEARAGLVLFNNWTDSEPDLTFSRTFSSFAPYTPGEFYLREMPIILETLEECGQDVELILVDCYVDLDEDGSPGLGRRLFDHFGGSMRVVGVAKSRFKSSGHAIEVLRGSSSRPLFVTAAGMPANAAADAVRAMSGPFRVPHLIKLADSIARQASGPSPS